MTDPVMHECPVCGRFLRIPTDWIGGEVRCGHCTAKFAVPAQAAIPAARACALVEQVDALLRATQQVSLAPAEAA